MRGFDFDAPRGAPPAARWHFAQTARGAGCLLAVAALLAACGTTPPPPAPTPAQTDVAVAPVAPADASPPRGGSPRPGAQGDVVGHSDSLLVYVPRRGDTLAAIADRFLGATDLAWRIAEANGERWSVAPGGPLIVPLADPPPYGVSGDGIQTVPVLCYHRFGSGNSKMIVSPERFEAQLAWLAREHYKVLRLGELQAFLEGRAALPARSVLITVDDGYDSFHRHAFPLLRKYGMPATLFVVSDSIGTRDGLSWAQLREMAESGLVEIQAHSKTHRNLIERPPGESDAAYRQALVTELRQPRTLLERQLAAAGVKVRNFAYPYGDSNDIVLEALPREGYEMAFTVNPGGNAFYASSRLLRRTMIFGDHDLDDFKARLQTRRSLAKP